MVRLLACTGMHTCAAAHGPGAIHLRTPPGTISVKEAGVSVEEAECVLEAFYNAEARGEVPVMGEAQRSQNERL